MCSSVGFIDFVPPLQLHSTHTLTPCKCAGSGFSHYPGSKFKSIAALEPANVCVFQCSLGSVSFCLISVFLIIFTYTVFIPLMLSFLNNVVLMSVLAFYMYL